MKIITRAVLDWDGNILEEESYEYDGPLALAGDDGAGKETVQTTEPWQGQQPFIRDIFQQAQKQFRGPAPTYFPGSTVAPVSQATTQAQNLAQQYATGTGQQQVQGVQGAHQFALNAPDVANNQYVQNAAQAAINPVFDTLEERALPLIRSQALATGGFGGSRQQLAEGNAVRDATREALDRSAGLFERAYGQGLDAQSKALGLAPQTYNLGLAGAETLGQVGAQQRQYEQQVIDDAIARHNFEQSLPATQLAQYQNLIQGNFGGQTTSLGKSPGQGQTASTLGGAASGAALGMAIAPQFGPASAGVGAAAGALMSFL